MYICKHTDVYIQTHTQNTLIKKYPGEQTNTAAYTHKSFDPREPPASKFNITRNTCWKNNFSTITPFILKKSFQAVFETVLFIVNYHWRSGKLPSVLFICL